MSKADTLLKRATFFERMALYSDRKTFLQAIAQEQPGYEWNRMEQTEKDIDTPAALDKQSRDLLYKAMKILQDNGLTANAVGNAVIFGKVDWNAIKQEINQATLTGLSPLGKGAEIGELKNILSQLSTKTPVSVAPQQPAAPKPAAQATGPQIARQLTQQAKSLWAQSSDKTGDERNKALTQINAILGQLLALRKNFAKSKDLQAQLAIAGISYLFNELYGAMSYDDLMIVKNFDFGRSEGFKETA